MDKMAKRKKMSDVGEAYDNYPQKRPKQEDLEVTGVSRSGRVRKKSSKLMDFESPDEIDNRYKRRDRNDMPPVMPHVMSGGRGRKPQSSIEKPIKMEHQQDLSEGEDMQDDYPSKGDNGSSGSDSELGMYPPPEGVEDDSSIDSLGSDVDEDEDMDDDSLVMDERSDSNKTNMRRDSQVSTPTQAQSLYMLEKSSKKKLIIRDGKIVGRMKAQRKDKGKSRFTAYMLWAKEIRQEILRVNPDMDFATMSKRLGELWATVPTSEKYGWKRRAKRMAVKGNYRDSPSNTGAGDSGRMKAPQSRSKFINKLGGRAQHSTAPVSNRISAVSSAAQQQQPPPTLQLPSPNALGNVTMSPPENKTQKAGLVTEPVVGPGLYKVVGTQPVDVAAHLKLLGESLSIIGERLKEHEGQIAVSGSLSVLLDSLLCALGPLLCLTQQVPETNGCTQELLNKILDNIAYFMPGL